MKFVQCRDDKCIYVMTYNNDKDIVYIGLYVDDTIIAGSDSNIIKRIMHIR